MTGPRISPGLRIPREKFSFAPGSHTLRFEKTGFWPKGLHVDVEAGKVTSLGRVTLDVDVHPCFDRFKTALRRYVTMPPADNSRIFGVARTEARQPLPHIRLTLRVSGKSEIIATTETARDGSFEFADLAPGMYDISAFEGEPLTTVRSVKVKAGRALELDLIWKSWPKGSICL